MDLLAQWLQSASDWFSSTGYAGDAALVTLVLSALGAILAARRARGAANDARESASVATRTLHRRTNQYASDLVLKSDEALIAHPELALYFKEPPVELPEAGTTRDIVLAVAEMKLDVAEAIWDHHDEFKDDDAEAWREWIHYMIQVSPALQHEDVLAIDFYPSLRTLLAGSGCSRPDEHGWAVATGREYAREDLASALAKVKAAAQVMAGAAKARTHRRRVVQWLITRRYWFLAQVSRSMDDSSSPDRSWAIWTAARRDFGAALNEFATARMRCGVLRAVPVVQATLTTTESPGPAPRATPRANPRRPPRPQKLDSMSLWVAVIAGASEAFLESRTRRQRIWDWIMGESPPSHLTRDVRELVAEGRYAHVFANARRFARRPWKGADAILKFVGDGDWLVPGDELIESAADEPEGLADRLDRLGRAESGVAEREAGEASVDIGP